MDISIIIPAYNEETGIAGVLEDILAAFPDQPGVEVLVVNDASQDATVEAVSRVQDRHKDWPGRIRILSHETNRGYGAAIKTGVAAASHANLVLIDADGTYPVSAIPGLVDGLATCEMAVGARTGLDVHIPLIRRPAKWLLGKLAGYLAGQRIPDMNSGLRAMRKPAVERHLRILPDGFSFTTTITMALLTRGDRVHFTPIDYRPRKGKSKIRPIRDTLNFLNLILRTAVYFNPLKVLTPLSLLLLLAALVVFLWSWYQGKILDATVSIMVVTAVQVAVLGLLADLVVRRSPD